MRHDRAYRCRLRLPLTAALFAVGVIAVGSAFAADVRSVDGKPNRMERSSSGQDALPRHLTPAERAYIRQNPLTLLRSATDPPEGPLLTPPEYAPMAGLMVSYVGNGAWKDILDLIGAHTTTAGDADMWVIVPNQAGVNEVNQFMGNAGADMSRVHIHIQPTNSIWIRDYGPRYVYEGNVRAIVDHTYNRPRPLDNAIPAWFSGVLNHAYYEIPLVHGGGNYHLDVAPTNGAEGGGYATRLINNENPSLTEQQIRQLWRDYQNLHTFFYNPYPTSIDSTQHIDMKLQVVSDDTVVISTWPANPGSTQQQICDAMAAHFQSRGYNVFRTPARRVSGVHYTYTNVVMINDIIMIPSYTNSTIAPYNAQALAAFQQAAPDKTIIQINSQGIVSAAGVLHCIVMHVPAPIGGENPTAYLRTPRGGETFDPDETVEVRWSSDDDEGVTSVDLLFSTDGGASFPHVIATQIGDTGSWNWTVPDLPTTQGRVRVVVHDGDGNTGFDQSDSDITITGDPRNPADLNGDGIVDVLDLLILLDAWGACDDCGDCPADLNGDCAVDVLDLLFLLDNWG